ncbi:MAG: serine/threonine-protein kinase [Pseudomonadota bacterium]
MVDSAKASVQGTSIRRISSGINRKITEGLLSSSGKVASLGLISAVITLTFTIWFVLELRQQSQVDAPLARQAAVLNSAINQSLAALRAWVAYGELAAKAERAAVWQSKIQPTLAVLETLAINSNEEKTIEQVVQLEGLLKELKHIQWSIEDVAHTPGNLPALVEYKKRLVPLRDNLVKSIQGMINYLGDNPTQENLTLLTKMARLRAKLFQADTALESFAEEGEEVHSHNVNQQLESASKLTRDVQYSGTGWFNRDISTLLEYVLSEFFAYETEAQRVMETRRLLNTSVAQRLYLEEAQPLVVQAISLSNGLAEEQAEIMERRSNLLSGTSLLVVAMALLMGVLSAGSMLVSVRLRQQVQGVLEREKRLGQYELDSFIGRGSMGEVYLAHHAMLRRPTAIKLLNADHVQKLRAQERFRQEVKLASQLTHPNTIEIFDYGRTPEGVFYYAMEYVDGFSIEQLVHVGGAVDPARVIHILLQACGSLKEAHDMGFLHRDIQPTNLMLTERGGEHDVLKILDFGLVHNVVENATEETIIVGTPGYMAPESILSGSASSTQSDLYSLGAIGYLLLTGSPAFDPSNLDTLLECQLAGDVALPSVRLGRTLPQDLENVVMACLAVDPADRPRSAEHLAELLRTCPIAPWTATQSSSWWKAWREAARASNPNDSSNMHSQSVSSIAR